MGSFDGVHVGHAEVIRNTVDAARSENAQPALITFEPHPRCVLDPANCPQSITTLQEKLALVESRGIEHAIVVRFDRALSALSPQEFVDSLTAVMELRRWVVGFDFAFGHARAGSAAWLRDHGHKVDVVPPVVIDGTALHSSDVRRLITLGDMDKANRLLGREYSMSGPVEAGDRVGRSLGFPTANIAIEPNKLVPALGAYAGRAAGRADDGQGAARHLDPVGETTQAAGAGQGRAAAAVVADADREAAGRRVHAHRRGPGTGMLGHIGQALRAEEIGQRP